MDGNNFKEDGHQRKCVVIILFKKIKYFNLKFPELDQLRPNSEYNSQKVFQILTGYSLEFFGMVKFLEIQLETGLSFCCNFRQSAKDFLHNVQLCFPIMLMGVQLVSSYKIYDMISCFLRSMYPITRTTSFLLSELFFSPPGYDHLLLHVLLLNDNGQDNFVHVRTILKLPCFIFIILIYGQLIK